MLLALPKQNQFIFNCGKTIATRRKMLKRQKALLTKQRLRVAEKLKNPRILAITYHTLRHWKATQLYHQTKDVLYVMKFLGHKSIKNTLIYIDLETCAYPHGAEEYYGKTAKTEDEAIKLVEAGFEYVCDIEGLKLFRKRR
jgi:integrase